MHTTNGTDGGTQARSADRALSDWSAEVTAAAVGAPVRVRYQALEYVDASTLDQICLLTEHPETGEPVEVVGIVFADGSHWPED